MDDLTLALVITMGAIIVPSTLHVLYMAVRIAREELRR